MKTIPKADDVRAMLAPLGYTQVQRLAVLSGVPFGTLWKVRSGATLNPRLDTVRRFAPYVARAKGSR